jgi:hypothetical protein
MSNEQYFWRINVGNEIVVGAGREEMTLPEGYHLEEARLLDGTERVYLMKGEEEIASWRITKTNPTGNDILSAIYENQK